MRDFLNIGPMRYFQPDSDMGIEADIIENPGKYSDYIASHKMDGEFSRVVWDGNQVCIMSRSISKKTGEYAHKEASLPHLVEVFKKLPANTVLLGELCFDDLYKRSKDVGSILRSLPALAIEKQQAEENKLHFYCFDVLCWADNDIMEKGFEERISYLPEVEKCLGNTYVRYANYISVEQVAKEYCDYLAQGGEGFVLQRKDNPYAPDKRPAWKTIKMKKCTEEIECPVIGFIEPEKEYTGKELATWPLYKDGVPVTKYYYNGWKAGVVVNNNGAICNIASGIDDATAEWLATPEAKTMLENGQIYAKCQAMEIEPDTGRMRHPRLKELRTDL